MSSGSTVIPNSCSTTTSSVTFAIESQAGTVSGDASEISPAARVGNTAAKHCIKRARSSGIVHLVDLVVERRAGRLEVSAQEVESRPRKARPEQVGEEVLEGAVAISLGVVERDRRRVEAFEETTQALVLDAPRERAAAHDP